MILQFYWHCARCRHNVVDFECRLFAGLEWKFKKKTKNIMEDILQQIGILFPSLNYENTLRSISDQDWMLNVCASNVPWFISSEALS